MRASHSIVANIHLVSISCGFLHPGADPRGSGWAFPTSTFLETWRLASRVPGGWHLGVLAAVPDVYHLARLPGRLAQWCPIALPRSSSPRTGAQTAAHRNIAPLGPAVDFFLIDY